jgi:hypothetical protein
MSTSLKDLNGFPFAQLQRLDIDHLTPDQIESEAKRAQAIVSIADQVINGADTALRAARLFAEHGAQIVPYLPQIGAPKPADTK